MGKSAMGGEGMTALHATAWLHGHYPATYVSQPRTSVYSVIYYYQYYNKEWLVHSSGVHRRWREKL